jgi:inorganic pyrophosphatase
MESDEFLNKDVRVIIDRPLGSKHPKHGFIYPLNYGYVPEVIAPDGEELDAYVLGEYEPLTEYTGRCIAVIHRKDDLDDKLVLARGNRDFNDEQIQILTEFQERFFESEITRARSLDKRVFIMGLDHIQLAMPPGHEDEARAFYRGLLELKDVPKPDSLAERGGCWFEGLQTFVHLGIQKAFVPARKAHPAFLVQNLDYLYKKLEKAEIPATFDQALPAVRRFYTQDPFGNRIEFVQDGDGFSQNR